MGMIGIHYGLNLLPIPDLYTGVGMYGAVTGENGGFFSFGIDNNYNPKIYKSLYLDSGVFVGGGGAHSTDVGGGLMVLPHLGLGYQLGNERITLDYSYATFPNNGHISGSQVMLGIIFPSDLNLFSPGTDSSPNSNISWQNDGFYLSPLVQIYHPKSGTTNLLGEPQSSNLGLAGAEGGKFITDRTFVALRAAAVGKGNANGYMNVMAGIGYRLPLTPNFYFVNDVFAGAGGGGNIQTGNGTELEADTGLAWQITPQLAPRLSIGYLTAPDGHFNTWVGSIGLNYDLNWLSPNNEGELHFNTSGSNLSYWRAEIYNQTLFDPKRTNGASGNINLIAGNLDQQLTPNWYLTYGTSFAYQGDHSGGLALGDLGAGYQFNANGTWHPHAALLVGAIGGGGIDVNGGFFVEPELGLRHDVTSQMSVDAAVGRMKSTSSGGLNSTVLNVGLAFSFGKLVQAQ